jgi:ATP-binding cassette, subfamily C (CFTR/MRP), member 1
MLLVSFKLVSEIGERGINLSGGQKQRVSIARAVYANADTIILDDPLSALDPEVGQKLFEECILGELKGKTVMFVTNQIQFLRFCDSVVALRHGRVIEHGKYSDLIANEKSEVKRLLSESASKQDAADKKETIEASSTEKSGEEAGDAAAKNAGPKKDAKVLTTKEEQFVGAVSFDVYKKYMKAGGGYMKFGLVYFGFVLTVINTVSNTAWISIWTSDANYERNSEGFYLGIFFSLTIALGIITFLRAFLLVRFGAKASEVLHRDLLKSVLRAPQSFFDTTPLGRIISRFSKDLYAIDMELTDFMVSFIY